jgi:arylamine N-acetyltransferase
MCNYFQTDPDSMFRKRRLCTRRRVNGRDTLADGELIETTSGTKSAVPLDSQESYAAALRDRFGLRFSGEEIARLWSSRPRE